MVGWSSERLAVARTYGNAIHTSAVMIVQGGEVVDQWGDVEKRLTSYSVRKSLISALYGIYSTEGVIDVNETLEHLGIDDSPDPLTKPEKQARVVDILRARSGVYHPVDFESPGQKKLRPARGSQPPAHSGFITTGISIPGTILKRRPARKSARLLRTHREPIGMQDFSPDDVFYPAAQTRLPPLFFEVSAETWHVSLATCGGRWGTNRSFLRRG